LSINAVLFDLDGTLLDRDTSLLLFVRDQYHRYSEFQIVEKEIFVQRFIELDNHGYVWKDKVYKQLIDEFSVQNVDWSSLLDDYIRNFHKHCISYPNLLSMLTQLKKHSIKLALISNGFELLQTPARYCYSSHRAYASRSVQFVAGICSKHQSEKHALGMSQTA